MNISLAFKAPWAMLKIAFLMVLFLAVAEGSQAQCGEGNQSCDQQWNLMAKVDSGLAPASDISEDDLAADMDAFGASVVSFGFMNQSASETAQEIVTGNDTAKFITFSANDVDNDLLDYTVISAPEHGTVSKIDSGFLYTPESGYVGKDDIVFRVSDQLGNLLNMSLAIDVISLYHPPSVRIRTPHDGEVFPAYGGDLWAEVPIRATATGDVKSIAFYDGTTLIPDSPNPQSCPTDEVNCPVTLVAKLPWGYHTLVAKATDTKNKNCVSLPVVIIVNPSEPKVKISNPYDGQIFTAPANIDITAEVTDSREMSYVEFFANSQKLGRITRNVSPYTFTWQDVKPGIYNLAAKAVDVMGASGTAISKSILIVVVPAKPLTKSDLALTMTTTPNPVPAGGLFNYILTVTNRGPDTATGVTLEDFLPSSVDYVSKKPSQGEYDPKTGFWSVGDLVKYRSAKLVLTVRAPSKAPTEQISNTAYVYGSEYDPDNSNNHVTDYVRIKA
ncbi:Uncharacterised protein [uncultured archaeon]|nr:Uncharacterised protein [uncultured archaeon]